MSIEISIFEMGFLLFDAPIASQINQPKIVYATTGVIGTRRGRAPGIYQKKMRVAGHGLGAERTVRQAAAHG
jgi:hypothetical protein